VTHRTNRQIFANAHRVDDDLDLDGERGPLRRREPRSGLIVEAEEERQVKMPKLLFLSRRFGWESP